MRPRPLRTRDDLLRLIKSHTPSTACERAIEEDRALVLGVFTGSEGIPTVLVRVTSVYGRSWFIGVEIDNDAYAFRIKWPTEIAWETWKGIYGRLHPVYDGDDPKTFRGYKQARAVESLNDRGSTTLYTPAPLGRDDAADDL